MATVLSIQVKPAITAAAAEKWNVPAAMAAARKKTEEVKLMDKCADCRFCSEGYCEIHECKVNTNKKACADFEEI